MENIPVNLPWFITFHASGLCILGLSMIFATSTSPPKPPPTILGIATLGLGLSYFSTSYMPLDQNAFLYASVPVRLVLAALAGLKAVMGGNGEEKGVLWGIMAWDGIGAVVLGWYLGVWSGRAPGL